jgi:hypothetical protein
MTSYHPRDEAEGYCGNCHDWTGLTGVKKEYSLSMPPEKPGPHVHLPSSFAQVRAFPDLESAWQAMRADEARANANVSAEQGLIGWGAYFEIPAALNMGLHAWGKVMDRQELEDGEREAGADDAETEQTMANMDNSYARGYRFSWTYSAPYPEGELGSVHVSKMRQCTKDEFEAARADGWR